MVRFGSQKRDGHSNMCARCGFSIVGEPQFEKDGKFYCKTCYTIISTPPYGGKKDYVKGTDLPGFHSVRWRTLSGVKKIVYEAGPATLKVYTHGKLTDVLTEITSVQFASEKRFEGQLIVEQARFTIMGIEVTFENPVVLYLHDTGIVVVHGEGWSPF